MDSPLAFLSDESIVEAYHEAKKLQLEPDFIQLIEEEICKRTVPTA